MSTRLKVDKLETAKKNLPKKLEYFIYLENFDKFFVNAESKLVSQIPKSNTKLSSHLLKIDTTFLEQVLLRKNSKELLFL